MEYEVPGSMYPPYKAGECTHNKYMSSYLAAGSCLSCIDEDLYTEVMVVATNTGGEVRSRQQAVLLPAVFLTLSSDKK